MKLYYVGWTGQVWRHDVMMDPGVDKRLKDPEKIERNRQERRLAQQEVAHEIPFAGRLAEICILNDEGEVETLTCSTNVAETLLNFYSDKLRLHEATLVYTPPASSVALLGFDLKLALRLAAMEELRKDESRVPVRAWYNPPNIYDPLEMLIPAPNRGRDFDARSLCAFFEFPYDDAALSHHPRVGKPEDAARLAWRLGGAMQLRDQ